MRNVFDLLNKVEGCDLWEPATGLQLVCGLCLALYLSVSLARASARRRRRRRSCSATARRRRRRRSSPWRRRRRRRSSPAAAAVVAAAAVAAAAVAAAEASVRRRRRRRRIRSSSQTGMIRLITSDTAVARLCCKRITWTSQVRASSKSNKTHALRRGL